MIYFKKIQSLDFFSSFAHYELTLNPFCRHCSNKILTSGIFVIRRKSFSLHVLYCKKFKFFAIDHSRGFWTIVCQIAWNSNDWIVRNRQVSVKAIGLNFSSNCACVALNWVLSVTKKKLRIVGLFASLPFLTNLCDKRLKSSIHCVQW